MIDKNIVYLYKELSNKFFCEEFNLSLFKNFVSYYSKKKYLKDNIFLKRIVVSELDLLKPPNNVCSNYVKRLGFKLPSCSQKIIFFNGCYHSSENIDSNISVKYFNTDYINFLDDLKNFSSDYIYDNLNFFYILNSMFFSDGVRINIPDDLVVNEPLYILNIIDNVVVNSMSHLRTFITVGKNAHVNIMESHFNSSSNVFSNVSTFLHLKPKSKMNYFLINDNTAPLLNVHSFFSKQDTSSNLNFNDLSFGNQFYKGIYNFFLLGRDSYLKKNIGRNLKGESVSDIDSRIFHYGKNAKSNILCRILGRDRSIGSFRGRLIVGFNVSGVDADLRCDGLLLSKLSKITLMPELRIDNNDVKCSHGATIGYIDDALVFYMMSRGLSKNECINIIISLFLSRCVDNGSLFFNILNERIINDYYTL